MLPRGSDIRDLPHTHLGPRRPRPRVWLEDREVRLCSTGACHKLKVKTFQKLWLIITHKLIRKLFLDILHTDVEGKKTEAKPQN